VEGLHVLDGLFEGVVLVGEVLVLAEELEVFLVCGGVGVLTA